MNFETWKFRDLKGRHYSCLSTAPLFGIGAWPCNGRVLSGLGVVKERSGWPNLIIRYCQYYVNFKHQEKENENGSYHNYKDNFENEVLGANSGCTWFLGRVVCTVQDAVSDWSAFARRRIRWQSHLRQRSMLMRGSCAGIDIRSWAFRHWLSWSWTVPEPCGEQTRERNRRIWSHRSKRRLAIICIRHSMQATWIYECRIRAFANWKMKFVSDLCLIFGKQLSLHAFPDTTSIPFPVCRVKF